IADNQWLEKIWQFELCQPPQGLPCSVNVPPITATPTVTVTRFPTVTPTPSRTVTRTPTRTPTRTVTPTRTPTLTPTPTPTMTCVPPRPPVTPECSPAQAPNAIRNQHFTLGPRSWGEFSGQGRELVNSADHRAEFYGPPGVANHELLYQLVSIPPDAQSVSFWVGDYSAFAAAWGTGDPPPPPPPGLNYLRVSLYDATLTTELARLWQIDLAAAPNCEPDPSSYNLTPGELALVRGQTVALVFEFQKVTTEHNWTAGAKADDIHLHICSPSPPCRVNRDKTASPGSVAPGGEVTVMLSLEGLDGACLPARQPSDVVLVLDRSGSMAGQPLQYAKTAAKGFVDRLDLAADQVAVVSFGNTASLDQTLTQSAGPPRAAIDALAADGVTNMADALRTAQAELTSPRHLPANRPVLILLSDGRPNPAADERAVAASARAAGTRIFTIGLGSQADAALLTELASSPSDYFYAPDSTQLDRIYQQIAGAIGGDPATNIVIEDRLSPYVTLVPNSFTGSPTPSVSADGKTLTWRIPRLGLETQRWSYRVKMTQTPGTWPTNSYATATYTNSRGQPGALVFPIPQVTVLAPAAKNPQIMCQDYAADTGRVPSNPNGEAWWDSPDIWVRNQPDTIEGHQNPLVGQQNYVTVRVRNIGDTAVNNIQVHVYAAPGAASIRWPDEWVPEIGTDTLATLAAGATGTVKVAWTPSKEGHTCFLARIEAPVDPITADGWVPFDNNICQKNVQVIDAGPTTSGVTVGNAHHGSGYGSVTVNSPPVAAGASARVTFTDAALFNRWQGAGGTVSGGQVIPGTTSIRLDLQPPAALVEGGQEAHELTSDVVFGARLDRIPLAGDETTRLIFEVETPPNAEPPTLQITEWMDGQAVGGNVLRRAMVASGQITLPLILKGHAP
ncbi:MAG: VWA domain-containing protein, partial [Anaerolineae bacterium]|nr:VWA domain-containing protein [Anaerolineae bacterium]